MEVRAETAGSQIEKIACGPGPARVPCVEPEQLHEAVAADLAITGTGPMIIHPRFIGIDVSKAHFDIFDAERGRPERHLNSAEVARALAQRLRDRQDGFAVFEATGHYDRHLRAAFDTEGVSYAGVNPQQARSFARALGRRAKTDAIDAKVLAALGQALQPRPTPARNPARQQLAMLQRRRDQLVDQRAVERTRLSELEQPASNWTRSSCSRIIRSINFSAFNRHRLNAG
jgi:Transposase